MPATFSPFARATWSVLFASLVACQATRAHAPLATPARVAAPPPLAAPSLMPTEPIEPILAPFAMPVMARPIIPAQLFDIRDFGAVADGKTKATQAIRHAIAQASAAGGGTVLVPAGKWLTRRAGQTTTAAIRIRAEMC